MTADDERSRLVAATFNRWEVQSREQLGRSLAGVWDKAMAAGQAEQPEDDRLSD